MVYASESAFRVALNARITAAARTSRWPREDLARAYALQVFLSRLFTSPQEQSWVLMGGTALQYRAPDQARPTADADLQTQLDHDAIVESLDAAAAPRPDQFGHFTVTLHAADSPGTYKGQLTYLLDDKRVATAKLDVGTTRHFVLPPVHLVPTAVIEIEGTAAIPPIRMNDPTEAAADKVAAMYQNYRSGPSTRSHDLVDLLILSRTNNFHADTLARVVRHEEQRRGCRIPHPLTIPRPSYWVEHYAQDAVGSGLPEQFQDLDTAMAVANAFVTPALTTTAPGMQWDSAEMSWTQGKREPDAPSVGGLIEVTRSKAIRRRQSPDAPPLTEGLAENLGRHAEPEQGYEV